MGGSIRVSSHQLQQLSCGMVEWNGVRSRSKTNGLVSTILVRFESSPAMVLRFGGVLGIVQSIGSLCTDSLRHVQQTQKNQTYVVPDVHRGAFQRLSLRIEHPAKQPCVIRILLKLANDGSTIGLNGNTMSIERSQYC